MYEWLFDNCRLFITVGMLIGASIFLPLGITIGAVLYGRKRCDCSR